MSSLSVVIIAKNSIRSIADAIVSAKKVSRDIILVDSGSTDGTAQRATELGALVLHIDWKGFGAARNEGASHAQSEYVLYLDADEVITPQLAAKLQSASFNKDALYGFQRRNFVGSIEIRYGEWAHDKVYRLHHKTNGQWNQDEVHERIVTTTNKRVLLEGALLHFTTSSIEAYASKLEYYATLSAANNFKKRKRVGAFKPTLSALFNFIKNYVFRMGILDGRLGWKLARLHANYAFMKYEKLRKLYKSY